MNYQTCLVRVPKVQIVRGHTQEGAISSWTGEALDYGLTWVNAAHRRG